ncbi:uncharacterized [Tachysurus ichikawai]
MEEKGTVHPASPTTKLAWELFRAGVTVFSPLPQTPALFPHKKRLKSFAPFNPPASGLPALQPWLSDERKDGEAENKGSEVECLHAKSSAQRMKRKGFIVGEG